MKFDFEPLEPLNKWLNGHLNPSSLKMTSTACASPFDLVALSAHLEDRLESCSRLAALAQHGDTAATAATLNSALLEMADIKDNIKNIREEVKGWRETLRKVGK